MALPESDVSKIIMLQTTLDSKTYILDRVQASFSAGHYVRFLRRNTQTVNANIVIFTTSNSMERLSKPLLSRFTIFEIPEYTYEEFEKVSIRIISKLPQNVIVQIVQIACSIWKSGSRDIRDILKIAKLINAEDTEDIKRLISIHQKYSKTGREYNN